MPFENEHSARLKSPGQFYRFRRTKGSGKGMVQGVKVPASISVIWGFKKKSGVAEKDEIPIAQALRFPIKTWTVAEAKAWLKKNKIKSGFEAAKKKKELDANIQKHLYSHMTLAELYVLVQRTIKEKEKKDDY